LTANIDKSLTGTILPEGLTFSGQAV